MSLDCSQRTLILAMFMRRYAKVRHVLRDYELEGEVSANHMQLPDEGKSDKMHRYTLDTHLCIHALPTGTCGPWVAVDSPTEACLPTQAELQGHTDCTGRS